MTEAEMRQAVLAEIRDQANAVASQLQALAKDPDISMREKDRLETSGLAIAEFANLLS